MIKEAEWFRKLTSGYDRDPEYQAEYLKLVFGEELGKLMDQQSISQADLARRIGSSRAYVTRIFRSNFNPTFETLAKLAIALDARVSLHLHPKDTQVVWSEVPVVHPRRAHSTKAERYAACEPRDLPIVADKPRKTR